MITQLHGDNLDLLSTLAPGSVQAIITSPPYFGLRSYQIPPSSWPEVVYTPLIGLPTVTIPPMVCQLGAESDPLAYIAHLVHVFRLARPALRSDGTLWVNLGDSYTRTGGEVGGGNRELMHLEGKQSRMTKGLPNIPDKNLLGIPARAALTLQADGWVWRNAIIWHAPNKMPESVRDRFTRAHEDVLLFGNSARYYFDSEAVAEPIDLEYLNKRTGGKIQSRQWPDHMAGKGSEGSGATGKSNHMGVSQNSTRNRRDVWSIATTPMPQSLRGTDDAHYAAWPPALVEVMVKASTANKACSRCGAAWVRQVEREAQYERRQERGQPNGSPPQVDSSGWKPAIVRDLGHAPACACEDADVGRCVVLDPFSGTGTTLAVAEALGRDSIGIDLGYQELQSKRTDNLQITMEAYL
jgi:DNA modification methylase